jgi:hypothetical protein
MRGFKWIEWNLLKISSHGLGSEEVESAFDRVLQIEERVDGSYQMYAELPSGKRIWVIWRYDRDDDEIPDVFGDVDSRLIFVITAF